MAQLSIDSKFLIGILTLVGALVAFIVKQLLTNKDVIIDGLNKEVQRYKIKLQEAEQAEEESRNAISELLDKDNLNSQVLLKLNNIHQLFNRLDDKKKILEEYRKSADWLDFRRQNWIDRASKAAIKKYGRSIPILKRQQFKKDIAGYLHWVYICLYFYGHPDVPIQDCVNHPTIQAPAPYIYAIKYIKNKEEWGELTREQSNYLKDMFDELIEKLEDEL